MPIGTRRAPGHLNLRALSGHSIRTPPRPMDRLWPQPARWDFPFLPSDQLDFAIFMHFPWEARSQQPAGWDPNRHSILDMAVGLSPIQGHRPMPSVAWDPGSRRGFFLLGMIGPSIPYRHRTYDGMAGIVFLPLLDGDRSKYRRKSTWLNSSVPICYDTCRTVVVGPL